MAETVLPDEVIVRILPELPVKSLLRFKSVCKTWYSTISDPEFCNKLHRKRPSVLICENFVNFSTMTIESLLSTTKNKEKALTPLFLPWETTEAPRLVDRDGNYFIGSCNGLVCVDHKSSKSGLEDLILWNPSTRKFRILPPRCPPVRKEFYDEHFVWFGYDETIHDYKLVWVDYHHRVPSRTKLHAFTLKSNAWRTKACPMLSHWELLREDDIKNPRFIGVLSNGGAIHWRVKMDGKIVILALDLAKENFNVLNFGNFPFDTRGGGGSCLVGGCSCNYDADAAGGMTLKVMKKYGLEGIALRSWEPVMYYRILFSSGKEILAVFDKLCKKHLGKIPTEGHRIIKFRIEEGAGGKVSSPKTLLCVPNRSILRSSIFLMEESLVSLGDD